MKVKHFQIRLNDDNLQQDEQSFNSFTQSVTIKKTSTQLISTGQSNFWSILVFYLDATSVEENHLGTSEKLPSFDPSTLNTEERNRFETLRIWRLDAAGKENFPPYVVAHNSQLGAIAKLNPTTTEDLLKVKGFNEKKIAKYGEEIIAVLNSL